MPTPHIGQCPFCGCWFRVNDAGEMYQPMGEDLERSLPPPQGAPRRAVAWVWPLLGTVVAVAAATGVLIRHADAGAVFAAVVLLAVAIGSWREWMKSRVGGR